MTLIAFSLLPALLLLIYGGLLTTWIHLAHRPDGRVEALAGRAGWVAFALYHVWILALAAAQQQPPIATLGQLAAFLGFLVMASQILVESRMKQRLLVILPLGTVTLLLLLAVAAGVRPQETPEAVRGAGATLHIALSLGGIAMLLGSGVFGAGELILQREIAQRTFGPFFASLPSLEDLRKLRVLTLGLGWLLITVSLGSAMIWMRLFRTDSELVASHLHPMVTLWVVVTALAAAGRFGWLRRSRLAALSVGLAALVMALAVVSVVEFFVGEWL
ncbi:MAG: hypothetical protein C4524_06755 [Candidatus Zixiibacteriota bacterium]|nr:MAG: hypothetical protein C4524_06755 [candidate division Zixibacteria bacterium]